MTVLLVGVKESVCGSSLPEAALMAPEVVRREKSGVAADIWGIGCCVLELLTLRF